MKRQCQLDVLLARILCLIGDDHVIGGLLAHTWQRTHVEFVVMCKKSQLVVLDTLIHHEVVCQSRR